MAELYTPTAYNAERIMINVGANKGYGVATFLALHMASVQDRLTARRWKHGIQAYAKGKGFDNKTHNFLKMYPDGPCYESLVSHARHTREWRVRAHMLELLPANRNLLRWLCHDFNITDITHVHDYAASNVTRAEQAPGVAKAFSGFEGASLSLSAPWTRAPRRGGTATDAVNTITIDDFMAREGIGHVWSVEVDTEGWDALVLEGMRGALRERRIAFVEFEYSARGFWSAGSAVHDRDRRSLQQTQAWLGSLGYTCFLQTNTHIAPISGACWNDSFERRRWSNVLCAHDADALDLLHNQTATRGAANCCALHIPKRPASHPSTSTAR